MRLTEKNIEEIDSFAAKIRKWMKPERTEELLKEVARRLVPDGREETRARRER